MKSRVERLVAIARRVADPVDPLGVDARARLGRSIRLSPEGIELALREHLETSPSNEEIEALVESTSRAPRCHVVLSANVCTAALRALALATATSEVVRVRPSRRDPVLAEILVREASKDPYFQGSMTLATDVDARAGDEVHVYGNDETIAAFRARLVEGVVVRAHGTGFGVAVVEVDDDLERATEAIARDVIPFDQAGCLSPRFVLVGGSERRARDVVRALDRALAEIGARVPRGSLVPDERVELTRYREAMRAIDDVHEGPSHLVALDPSPRALSLPPALRVVLVARVAPSDVARLVPMRFVTTIGATRSADGLIARALDALAPGARRAALGVMQRPPFDGPVDRRSVEERAVLPDEIG